MKLGTVSPSRWHSDSSWQPNTWSGEKQSEVGSQWQHHPWNLFSTQAFPAKLDWLSSLSVSGLGKEVQPSSPQPPQSAEVGKAVVSEDL